MLSHEYFLIDMMAIKNISTNAAGIRLQEHIVQKHRNDDTSRVMCSSRWTADFEYHVAREGWAAVCKNYNARFDASLLKLSGYSLKIYFFRMQLTAKKKPTVCG